MSLLASRGVNSHRCAGYVWTLPPGAHHSALGPLGPSEPLRPRPAPSGGVAHWPRAGHTFPAQRRPRRLRPEGLTNRRRPRVPPSRSPGLRPKTCGSRGRFGVYLLTTHPLPSSPPTPPQPTPGSLDASLTRCWCPGRGPPPDSPSLPHRDVAPGRGVVMKGVQAGLRPGDTPGPAPGWGVWPRAAPAPPARGSAERGHLSSLRRFIWGGEQGVGGLSWWRGRLIYRQACFEAPHPGCGSAEHGGWWSPPI